MKVRWFVAPLVCAAAAMAVVFLFSSMKKQSMLALRANMMSVSQRYPKFTLAQRRAVLREYQSEMHPMFRDLSATEVARRLLAAATATSGGPSAPAANFSGNLTAINGLTGDLLELERTSTCSLTMVSANYVLSLPSFTFTIDGAPTLNYDQILHNAAQLKTNGGNWPAGCGDPIVGLTAKKANFIGVTTAGYKVYGDTFYDGTTQSNDIETVVAKASTDADVSSNLITSLQNPLSIAGADLNGDGNADLVALSDFINVGQTAMVSVLLGDSNGDGGFGSPTNYALPGEQIDGAVIDDFNGDGKLDIVVTTTSLGSGTGETTYLSFLEGNGNGTFAAAQNVTLTPPAGATQTPYGALISTSVRGNGEKDLVTGGGVILYGNGNGTFTQSPTLAFPSSEGTSEFGPNLVAADFNKDGKVDLAFDDGASIQIFLGNGAGTFTSAGGYATIDNVGYITGSDIDGDTNPDVYSGVARAGIFGGDQFEFNQGYALMGNGDGTFQGAPEMPFAFTGTNLMDLNGDGIPDGVGVDATINSQNVSLTSYIGSSKGSFTAKQTFPISPVTISGTTFQFSDLDSFGLGDLTGSGKVDLVYLPAAFYGPGGVAGYFVAMGNGDGTFGTPAFVAAPTFAPTGDFDQEQSISDLFVADVNGDGKADLIYNYSVEVSQTGVYEQGIAVQLSNGDGTFQAPQVIQTYSSTTVPTGTAPLVAQVGHTRAGGALDIFAETSTTTNSNVTWQLELYLGNGDGTFAAATMPPVADNIGPPSFGSQIGQIALADMNGDGKPDLITLGTTTSGGQAELAISLGNGNGTFQTPTILDFAEGSSVGWGLAAADFNGDGKVDVAVTGFNPPYDTGVFLGNGNGTMQSFTYASGEVGPAQGIDLVLFGADMSADFNGDGRADLVAGSAVLINQGAASTLTPSTTTLSVSPATTVSQGTTVTFTATVSASSTPAGSVTFNDGATALGTATLGGNGMATFSTGGLGVGVHTITAVYAGNSTFAASTSPAVAVTVNAQTLPATTSTLTASPTTITAGANVTLTDTVSPQSGTGTPTGTVAFMNGTTNLGSATLNGSGVATFSTTALPVGADAVTAVYSGDTNFAGSASAAVTITVSAAVPSFSIAASPTSATVTAGSSTTTTITVTPGTGFSSPVNFACSGLPTGGTCTFNPTTVTPSGSSASTTLTIATTSQSAAMTMPERERARRGGVATAALLAAGALWVFGRRKRVHWIHLLHPIMLLLVLAGVAVGCGGSSGGGGGGGGSSQAYTITITGTAGSQSQTATFTLTVN
jgi:hypothetical protein